MLKVVVQLQNLTLQKITAIGIFLGGCVLAVYAATETAAGNTRSLILIFAAICGGIFIINLKENFWLILPVGLSLNLPTIPLGFRQISSQELAITLATLLFILRIAMHNQPIKLRPIWSWPIFFYLACVALSFTLRPVGLWAFGSNSGGARYYVQIALAFSAFLILSSIAPKERHLKFILIACLLGNLITAGWNILCYFLFPAFTWLTTAPTAFAEEESFYSWHQALSQVSLPVYTFILVSMPFQRLFSVKNLFWSIPCLIACLIVTALSGKRAAMAMMFLFPLVIALARPHLQVTLIEPLERRVDFLNEAVAAIPDLPFPIQVIRGRAQDVKKSADFVTARAVAPLEKLKKMSWHMVKTGGSLLAMKGESAATEMVGVKGAELHEIKLDGIELGRIISIGKGA